MSDKRIKQVIGMLFLILMATFGYIFTSLSPAKAEWNVNPPMVPNFPVDLQGRAVYESSPMLADVNGDGLLDIVIGGADQDSCRGRLYAVSASGDVLWDIQTRAPINSTPAVYDIDDDGVIEVVVGMGTQESKHCSNGGLLAVSGTSGQVEWIFDTQDWLEHVQDGYTDPVFSSPSLADFDDDGKKEVVFGAWDQCIYMLDSQGNPMWPDLTGIPGQVHCGGYGFYNEDTIWSSPVVVDLDQDGELEIVIGADITAGNRNGDPSGGYLYVFDDCGNVLARQWLDQAIYSSPAIGDLDGDGELEIVIGTSGWFSGKGYYVSVWNYRPGSLVTDSLVQKYHWPTCGVVFSSPSLADLNKNGSLDVIAISNIGDGPWIGGADYGSKVYAWDGATGEKLFETMICDAFGNAFNVHASPTIADIDGDDYLEILYSHAWEVGVLNHDGTHYTDYSSHSVNNPACARTTPPTTNMTFWATWSVFGTPAIGDLDNDSNLEVYIGGGAGCPNNGKLYGWELSNSGTEVPWSMFRRDPIHSGQYSLRPSLDVMPSSVRVMHPIEGACQETISLSVGNQGAGDLYCTITSTLAMQVSPSSNLVVSQDHYELITLTFSACDYPEGDYNLGEITVSCTADQPEEVLNSPASVPVSLYVGEVYQNFLPSLIKNCSR